LSNIYKGIKIKADLPEYFSAALDLYGLKCEE